MIVVVAGHIDHGKTALVRALTGIETDRLPEERRRGISIEAGFAHWQPAGTPDARSISFVDVPGHQRYVRNLIAGVQGARVALLVIACDDGVMPQTREHAAILQLLGVECWLVALTKSDQIGNDALQLQRRAVARWLDGHGLAAEIVAVSAHRGSGVDELAERLRRLAEADDGRASADARVDPPVHRSATRLCVDRVFVAHGDGLVITGTLGSGVVEVGDSLQISSNGRAARVRGLQMAGRPVERAWAGQRCAINLSGAGIERNTVQRGDWIVDPAVDRPVATVDGWAQWLAGAMPGHSHGTLTVQVHAGTTRLEAHLTLRPTPDKPAPGDRTLVRLRLVKPVSAAIGDRWIVRSADGSQTLGGIVIAWPFVEQGGLRGQAHTDLLLQLQGLGSEAWLASALAACPLGLDPERVAAAWLLPRSEARSLFERAGARTIRWRQSSLLVAVQRLEHLKQDILQRTDAWHASEPERIGLDRQQLIGSLPAHEARCYAQIAIDELQAGGLLIQRGDLVLRPGHVPASNADDERFRSRALPMLSERRSRSVHEIAAALDMPVAAVQAALRRLALHGHAVAISPLRTIATSRLDSLVATAVTLAQAGRLRAGEFGRETGIGRNLSIEVLEFFDRIRLTRRIGDRRIIIDAHALGASVRATTVPTLKRAAGPVREHIHPFSSDNCAPPEEN